MSNGIEMSLVICKRSLSITFKTNCLVYSMAESPNPIGTARYVKYIGTCSAAVTLPRF